MISRKIRVISDYIRRRGVSGLLLLLCLLLFKRIARRYFWRGGFVGGAIYGGAALVSRALYGFNYRVPLNYSVPSFSKENVASFKKELACEYEHIIEVCNSIVNGTYISQAGYRIDFTTPDIWITDHITGKKYPVDHDFKNYRKLILEGEGDPRLLWEINRLQVLVLLAQGYVLSHNAKYMEFITILIESWVEQNPFKQGVNWIDTQEVGIRMTSLIHARNILRSEGQDIVISGGLDELLNQHALYLFCNLSVGRFTHNHLLTELTSLFIASINIASKNRYLWFMVSSKLLKLEINKQLNSDGLSAEGSTNYTFFILDAIVLYNHLYKSIFGHSVLNDKRADAISNVINSFCVGSDDIVKIGDADCGRYVRFGWKSDLSRKGWLAVLSSIFGNRYVSSGSEELFWLDPLAWQGMVASQNTLLCGQSNKPILFSDSGFLSYRSANRHLILRFGPPSLNQDVRFGHSHSDYLSYLLYIDDMQVFVDPGTYTYLGRNSLRSELRSCSFHNTVTLDNREFLDVHRYTFGLPHQTTVKFSELKHKKDIWHIAGRFEYNLQEYVERCYVFDKELSFLALIDRAVSASSPRMVARYCIGRGLQFKVPNTICKADNGTEICRLSIFPDISSGREIYKEEFAYSPRYGVRKIGNRMVVESNLSKNELLMITVIDMSETGAVNFECETEKRKVNLIFAHGSVCIDMDSYWVDE